MSDGTSIMPAHVWMPWEVQPPGMIGDPTLGPQAGSRSNVGVPGNIQ